MAEIISIVEEKRERVRNMLRNLLSGDKISAKEYSHLLEKSELLGKNLTDLLTAGKMLVENEIIKDLNELFKFEKKPQRTEQIFEIMKELILSSSGSKNPYIQRMAYSIARERSKELRLPENIPMSNIYSNIRVPVPKEVVEEMHGILLRIILTPKAVNISDLIGCLEKLKFDQESLKSIVLIYHAREVAEAIYNWVGDNIGYVSEPRDWYKPAVHTLIVGGGDCDCLAILLCSLWRSIGFRTYLGFLPGHVFPGVILSKPLIISFGSLPIMERKMLREEKEGFPNLQDDDFVIVNKENRIPSEIQFIAPSIKIDNVGIILDNFTLGFMEDSELRDLIEELKGKNEEAINHIESFLKLREAKVFDIPSDQ